MRLADLGLAVSIGGLACMGAAPSARAQAYQQVYSFSGAPGDSEPFGGLTMLKGRLFGTTELGGASGYGTVFPFDPQTSMENTIYAFQGGNDGGTPICNLIAYDGLLYGTTFGENGGVGYGTVFSLDSRTHVETVLHDFQSSGDGGYPEAGLLDVAGTLYGTTHNGGTEGIGTVFSVDAVTGTETLLYSFLGNFGGLRDGEAPSGALIQVNGLLYGTTAYGGEHGQGTVFSINPANGTETIVASFKRVQDGAVRLASLINVGGKLYGTASAGGDNELGTVFSLDLSTHALKAIYRFQGGSDGARPHAGLITLHGTLYGTTNQGGTNCGRDGCGTVFSVNIATKDEKVVYAFKGGKDGSSPLASLTAVRGVLYGTTLTGGTADAGTIFKITP